ncbi:MAG: YesL family protein [Oscillospiraceae bacterium]|nr:YesL family protein [Oscillospiraceae bacterium]
MRSVFNPDNFLWRGFGKLADYIVLSSLWFLCSLPVVTIGPATIALYDATAHCVRGPEGGTYRRFFHTFKRELGRGILMTLFWGILGLLLNFSYQIICQLGDGSNGWSILSIVYFCSLFIPLGTACWAVILESRFTYSFGALHKNALLFTFAYLPYTAAIVALFVVALNICINIFPLVMIVPGVMMYLLSFFSEKVLKKYMPEEEE